MKLDKQIANKLLQIKAIKLEPTNPFTWASGWNSPIYCDNRKALSYPELRKMITSEFVRKVKDIYPDVEVIAGVATGAIALGVLVAEEMGLPFVYIRSSAKKHGMSNQVEGEISEGQKTVVIEDLVSTGGSSLKAVKALREKKADVMGMLAIFTYNFPIARENFMNHECKLTTLTCYDKLIEVAVEEGVVSGEHISTLNEWRQAPEEWGKEIKTT